MLHLINLLIAMVIAMQPQPSRPACSLFPFPVFNNPGLTYFVATGLPDSVRVPTTGEVPLVGSVMSFSTPPGTETLPVIADSLYGQVVRLERVGGAYAGPLRERMAAGTTEAIVVPYGYRPDCRTIVWDEGVVWIDTSEPGLLWADLRPESEWIDDRPTLDLSAAWHQPYPNARIRSFSAGQAQPELTIDELWSLFEVLPDAELFATDAAAALGSYFRWKKEHPQLSLRYPAEGMIRAVEFYTQPRDRR